MFSIVIKELKL